MKTLPLRIFSLKFWRKVATVVLVSTIPVGTSLSVRAQDPLRFADEIKTLVKSSSTVKF
jgi:hypothetical protein